MALKIFVAQSSSCKITLSSLSSDNVLRESLQSFVLTDTQSTTNLESLVKKSYSSPSRAIWLLSPYKASCFSFEDRLLLLTNQFES